MRNRWTVPLNLFPLLVAGMLLYGCRPQAVAADQGVAPNPQQLAEGESAPPLSSPSPIPTAFPTRPAYDPGELVSYVAQTGDTLPSLAAHFNTSVLEILEANPFIPAGATTMPPGMPMEIPIYYAPFWGSPYQILPDSLFVNGPAQVDFHTEAFVASTHGWLKEYSGYAANDNRNGAQIVILVARNFSISPRLLLALLEYQSGALTQPSPLETVQEYPLGYEDWRHKGLYLQLVWAANTLNNGYYGWRTGELSVFEHPNGRLERPDPWQNAATVALQYYFSKSYSAETYAHAIAHNGIAETYRTLFGDPWEIDTPHIPGSLVQPEFTLPFTPGLTWAFTGGPHTSWGQGEPLAALDFAPGSLVGGCTPTTEWTTAIANGVVVRSEPGIIVLDLDNDGDERTGWDIFYLHVGTEGRAPLGEILQTGDPIGHPSCEGGRTTGTHIHIARKYNGEWIPADGPLAFNLEGWIAHNGAEPYQGSLTRNTRTVIACECSDQKSQIQAEGQ